MGTKVTTTYSFKAPTMPPKALISSSYSAPLARLLWSSPSAAVSLAAGCESARYLVVKAENAERRALSLGSFCIFSRRYLLKAGAGLVRCFLPGGGRVPFAFSARYFGNLGKHVLYSHNDGRFEAWPIRQT